MNLDGELTRVASAVPEPEEQEQDGRRRGLIFLLLIPLLLGAICAWSFFANVTLSSAESFIPAGLHSSGLADYSPDEMRSPIRGLQIRIIEGVIRDRDPEAVDVEQRATDVVKALESPIPTVTPQPGDPTHTPPPTPTRTLPPPPATSVPTSAVTSAPSATPDGSPTPTPTSTPSRTPTASRTPTNPPPAPTATKTKTATPGPCKVPPELEINEPLNGASFSWMDDLTGQARAYDPDNVDPNDCLPIGDFEDDNGVGIASATPAPPGVEFKIEWFDGVSWNTVHEQDQFAVRYCAFTGTGTCQTHDLGTLWWPDPDGAGPLLPEPISSGLHKLYARAWDDEGDHSEWEYVTFTLDVDPTPVPAAVTVDNVTATEGSGLTFTVTLDNTVPGGFTVNVTLTDASATGGSAPLISPEDYNNVVAALSFSGTASETRQFTVDTLDDTIPEGDETFTVSLIASDPLVTDSDTGIGSIIDNEPAPVCPDFTLGGFGDDNDRKLWWNLTNAAANDVTLDQLNMNWGVGNLLTKVELDGGTIWTGNSASPVSISGADWIGGSRLLASGATKQLRFTFQNTITGSFTLTVYSDFGCDYTKTNSPD